MKPFWHELEQAEQETILHSGLTVQQFLDIYSQPEWCAYPDALGGEMGCWSLMSPGRIRRRENCEGCEYRNENG